MLHRFLTTRALFLSAFSAALLSASLGADAAIHYQAYVVLPSGGTHVWTYICPTGQKMVVGGFDSLDTPGYSSTGLRLTESYASAPDTWKWRFYNQGPAQAQYRLQYTCTSLNL